MRTIREPRENVAKIWGVQKKQDDKRYRLMRYLLRVNVEDGVLLHNVVTGHLVLLDAQEAAILDSLPAEWSDGLWELLEAHFLVPEDYDEHKAVLKLKSLLKLTNTKKDITGYTILPTTNCNARCFYCYEAGIEHFNMSEETADKVVDFIADHCGEAKKVSISWFGGEPTLGWKRIDQICKGLAAKGIDYSASMVSNGYLFDEEMAKKARELWKLGMIQITLDGTEEVYNRVKSYVSSEGSAYQRVMGNIGLLLEQDIRVSVRMNLDRHNSDDLALLVEELRKRFAGQKSFSAYVWPLFDDCGYKPVQHEEEDHLWLTQRQNELNDILRSAGMYSEREQSLPCITENHCMADNKASLLINANGDFAKCEHTFATDTVGNLREGITNPKRIAQWQETVEYPECADCCLFPSCHVLKHCFSTRDCPRETRERKKQSYERVAVEAYEKKTTEAVSIE